MRVVGEGAYFSARNAANAESCIKVGDACSNTGTQTLTSADLCSDTPRESNTQFALAVCLHGLHSTHTMSCSGATRIISTSMAYQPSAHLAPSVDTVRIGSLPSEPSSVC